MSFCLVDGSILSAPYDPNATLVGAKPRSEDLQPTEVLLADARPESNSSTVDSGSQPEPLVKTIPAYPNLLVDEVPTQEQLPLQSSFLIEPTARGKFMALYVLLVMLVRVIAVALWLSPLKAPGSVIGSWAIALIGLAFCMALLGGSQAVLLRKNMPSAGRWIFATIVGGVLGFLFREFFWRSIVSLSSTLTIVYTYDLFVELVAMGFITSAQWLILRRFANSAWWWIVASVTAGGVNYLLFLFMLRGLGFGRTSIATLIFEVLIEGLAVGFIQGLCLIFLRRKQIA